MLNPASHLLLGPSQVASAEGQKVCGAGAGAHDVRVFRASWNGGVCTCEAPVTRIPHIPEPS